MKRLITSFVLVMAVCAGFAQNSANSDESKTKQDKYRVVTNTFWNNTFVEIGFGGSIFKGDGDSDHDDFPSFKNRLFGTYRIAVGKWFTPVIGVRAGVELDKARVYIPTQDNTIPHWDRFYNKTFSTTSFSSCDFHVDAMADLFNLFGGYKEDRFYTAIAYGGAGFLRSFSAPKNRRISTRFGLINQFRLNDRFKANLQISGKLFPDSYNGYEAGHAYEGIWTLSAGVTYRLGKQGWKNYDSKLTRTENEYMELQDLNTGLRAENEALRNAPAPVAETITKVLYKVAPMFINFKIESSEISEADRINLSFLAEAIKAVDSDARYTITGYADKGTGTAEYNAKLSEKRAQAVYDCLVNDFGVPAEKLIVDYKGGVENMFNDNPRMSRATIMREAE